MRKHVLGRCEIVLAGALLALSGTGPLAGRDPETKEETWWSLKPIVKPSRRAYASTLALPAVGGATDWIRNPIDRFILARLQARGMKPSPEADRRTLLRRLSYDLVGLPPTPEETEAFRNDSSPDAYEKVVDRLLASPHFGERWARHWMDVIHFAETHGHDQDVPRDHAWPYRDYLIEAFNSDKPYGRFIEEQIAGDVLFPDGPQATVALGFLAAGPWDESSLKDIREDTLDRKFGQYLDRDDMIGTVSLAFLSTTVQCARCHDHKFDPISQQEYYGFQAVFAGVDRADRPYDPDPAVRLRRLTLLKRKTELESQPGEQVLKDPGVVRLVAAWEKMHAESRNAWHVLNPAVATSSGGSTTTKMKDGSVLFGGQKPDKDTYVIEAVSKLSRITAVRLEVLSDDSLPMKGPGRQDNGNLHLSEFQVQVAPAHTSGLRLDARHTAVPLARASADFNQDGWDIAKAIDGNMATAWGIHPAVGQSHSAVFTFKEPVSQSAGARLIFKLEQQHGQGHLIGRPRLSVTSAANPESIQPLPAPIQQILAKNATQRSDKERGDLARHVLRSQVETELSQLPPPRMVYAAASEFTAMGSFRPAKECRPINLLKRGDIRRPGKLVAPGGLAAVSALDPRFKLANPKDEGQRRAALARWISAPKNPLTWRSIVNRLWHHHFGRGIVATPNDFGRMGALPSHPELLDWLAATLLEEKGLLKKLHRLMVTSAAYRQSSRFNPEYAKADADNNLLWRMNVARLDAESLRDAVLRVSGKLDPAMGGPSVKHFIQAPGIHRTPKADYLAFDPDAKGGHRRAIYRFIFRTVPDPFMDALDCPDASQFVAKRSSSVTALQALALLNDQFIVRMSEHFARRVAPGGPLEKQVEQAYVLALGRESTPRETAAMSRYAARHGMANACRLLFNCNEFLFVP